MANRTVSTAKDRIKALQDQMATGQGGKDHLPDPTDPDATEVLGQVRTDGPLEARAGNGQAMVPARIDDAEQRAGESAVKLARVAEQTRWAAAYTAEAGHRAALIDLLTRADDWAADRKLTPVEVVEQVIAAARSWGTDRGVS